MCALAGVVAAGLQWHIDQYTLVAVVCVASFAFVLGGRDGG